MSSDLKQHGTGGHEPRDYSDKDIRIKPILVFGICTAIFTAVSFLGVALVFKGFRSSTDAEVAPSSRFVEERVLPPEPRLQVNEKRTLQEQRAIDQAQLTSYAWVDKGAGIVRIPVERAVDLVAERGLPSRPADAQK